MAFVNFHYSGLPEWQDFEEEQGQVAKLLLQLRGDSPTQKFAVLCAARERLTLGGPARLRHTLPPLAFAALRLAREVVAGRAAGSHDGLSVKEVPPSASAPRRLRPRNGRRAPLYPVILHVLRGRGVGGAISNIQELQSVNAGSQLCFHCI